MSARIGNKLSAQNLTEGNIFRQLFFFAMPLLLGNLLQQVYYITDSIIVGQWIGSTALAAVGTASSITILMVNFFTGMANGAGIILAQYVGAGDYKKLNQTIRTAAVFTVCFGLLCSVVGLLCSPLFLQWMDTPADVFRQANAFLTFCFVGMLPMLMYNMGAASMQAMGDSKTPLRFLSVACVVNVVLDVLFIKVLGMDVEGTAIATCLAQAMAAVLVFLAIRRKMSQLQGTEPEETAEAGATFGEGPLAGQPAGLPETEQIQQEEKENGWHLFQRMALLGLPIGMQSVVINFSNVVVQSHINSLGSDVMAAWSAFSRLDGFIILPLLSFGLAVMTFTGQNFGARKPERILGGVKAGLILSCGFTIALELLVILCAEPCFSVFTKSEAVIDYACNMVYYMVPLYFTLGAARVFIGVISGTGNSIMPMIINILFMCVFRVIFLPVSAHLLGQNLLVVYYTYWISWILSLISIVVYYKVSMKKVILLAGPQ
ncbi:MATE family efflux transporter [Aminipila butyrica]|uniref:MATE family efflux transporter n=1 Tax=Aminipila butyrica TaxID=433296 RepID=A0A858BZZ8_9FIRM|nr:MATE family efflux transporter [Aminipila butyrica]QIB70364.1 MATE family efflux transporter [Aminipila butyrica]